jgi:hypothetical protein
MKLILLILLFSISGIIGAFCWPYAINSWLLYAGKPPRVLWWHGFLLGYVPGLGQMSVPAAVLTWIVMMFLA